MVKGETMVVEEPVTQMVVVTAMEEEAMGLAEEGTAREAARAMAEEVMARDEKAEEVLAREETAAEADMEAEPAEVCRPAPTR